MQYKVKERHLLRPSKRLKKQQAQLQAIQQQQAQANHNNNNDLNKSIESRSDLDTATKLKNALIGNKPIDQKFNLNNNSIDVASLQPLLQQSLFQTAAMPNLQQSNLTSNLIKQLQENDFSDQYF